MVVPKAKKINGDAVRIGAVIHRLRIERGWSLVTLARRSGMHPTYLGVLEKGGNAPSVTTLFDLADVFNINASDIIREAEEGRREAAKRRAAAMMAKEG